MKTNLGLNTIRCNKKSICSLSLILMLTMTLMIALAQPSLSQVGISQPVKTSGYISVAPTLIGVGQTATVNLWVFPTPQTYGQLPAFEGYNGITVTFTKPDGTKDTFMPIDGTSQFIAGQTESTGNLYFFYEPDTAGDWSVSFTMPEQNITDSTGTVIYAACTSSTAYFTVQEDPVLAGLINGYPWAELPNDNTFWKYPINSNNREWNQISGDWLLFKTPKFSVVDSINSNSWQPYGTAPNTPHIVWDYQTAAGGLIGGTYGSVSYAASTLQTSVNHQRAIVIEGKVYINANTNQFECIDLTTGQVLYTVPGQLIGGIHLPGNAYLQNTGSTDNKVVLGNSFGSTPTPYLFGVSGTTWNYYDPDGGSLLRSISNVSASNYHLIDGTNIAYGISQGNLFAWDMSKVVGNNWPTGINWTVPTWIKPTPSILGISSDLSTIVLSGTVQGTNQYCGYSAKDGTSLWNLTLPYSVGVAFSLTGPKEFVVYASVDATFNCYSMTTGALLWTSPSFSSSPWATEYAVYSSETNDNSNVYIMFPDGTMTALSLETGQIVWQSTPIASTEFINNVVPYFNGIILAGDKIYAYAGYSIGYQINPIPRSAMMTCVNATTGDTVWTLNGGVFPEAAAAGYILGYGQYDGNVYCVGKGQTSTSVTIQNNVVANHATALITGNVLDQSPAAAGTPAVADSSMSEWMDYLHMQNSTLLNNPPTPEGVQVTLTALYPDGSTQTIGTTTTNSEGNYGLKFVPNMTGTYTISASFAGTQAYWPSDSQTMLEVVAGSEATTSPPIANPPYEMYTIGSAVAVIIALAVVAVLLLRKKP
jgi:hypothetical protein